jgi:mono/diheme cytochrome c family protein
MRLWGSIAAVALSCMPFMPSLANDAAVARGKYLVTLGGCQDCHTPGHFFGKPDMTRALGGSEVGFEIPELGTFYGPNLTPDKATGLGGWTDAQVIAALQTGKRPDGRMLAPIMPWRALAVLTKEDAQAVVAYLRSLPPVSNKVPGPFGPGETPTSFVSKIVPPGAK